MEFTTILEDLNFADDIAPLSSGMNHLQQKTTLLENNAAKGSLKLNNKKCKVIKVKSKRDDKLKVRESEVEEVESFTYLGTNITKDGGGTADINKRIALASAHIKRLSNIWKASEICRKTKSSLFKSLALSIQVERNSAGWNKWTSSMQLLTDISGEIMSEPYVPGTETIKDTFPIRNSIHQKYGPEDESLKLPDNQTFYVKYTCIPVRDIGWEDQALLLPDSWTFMVTKYTTRRILQLIVKAKSAGLFLKIEISCNNKPVKPHYA